MKSYPQVNLQLVDRYLTASLQSALENGITQLNWAGRTPGNEAPCAFTPAPIPLLINMRQLLCKVTAQLLPPLLNNKLEPFKVTLILNKIVCICLNTLKFMHVHFTSWVFKIIFISIIDFTHEGGSSDFSES